MNRNDSQGLAIVARPDKSLNQHFVATSQLAPPGSAVCTALSVIECIHYFPARRFKTRRLEVAPRGEVALEVKW